MTNEIHRQEYDFEPVGSANIGSDFETGVVIPADTLDFLCSLGYMKKSFDSKLPDQHDEGDENHIYRSAN